MVVYTGDELSSEMLRCNFTSVVLIALGGFTQQLGNSRAHCLGVGSQVLRALLQLKHTHPHTQLHYKMPTHKSQEMMALRQGFITNDPS